MRKHGRPEAIVTDRLRSYGAALKNLGAHAREETGRWLYDRAEDSHLPFRRRERAMLRCRGMRSLQKLPLSTPPSSTTSTRNEAFPAETTTRRTELPLPQSGAVSVLNERQPHCPGRDEVELVWHHLNARMRNELLNGEIFCSIREAQILIEQWRRHYNTVRPHSALGYRLPAPEGIIPMDQRPVMR